MLGDLVEGADLAVAASRCALMRSSRDCRERLDLSEMPGDRVCGLIWLPILPVPLRFPLSACRDCGNVPRDKEL